MPWLMVAQHLDQVLEQRGLTSQHIYTMHNGYSSSCAMAEGSLKRHIVLSSIWLQMISYIKDTG